MGFSTIVAAWFQPEESTGSRTGAIHLTVQTPTGPPLKIDAMPGDTLAVLRARIAAHGFAPERQCLTVDGVAIESWTYKRWCQKVVPGALLQLSDAQEQSQLLLHATEAAKKVAVDTLHAHTEATSSLRDHFISAINSSIEFNHETVGGLQLRRPDGTAKHFRHFIAKWDETRGCWAVTWGKNKSGKNRRSLWASCASAPPKERYVTGASDWPDGPAEYGFLLHAASGEPDLAVAASTASDKERWLRKLDPAGAAVRVADKKKLADLETACITARNTYDDAERAFKEAIAEAEAFEASRVTGVAEANNAQKFVVEIEPLLLKMEGQLRAKEWRGALVAMGKAKDRASAIKFRRHDLSDQQQEDCQCASSPVDINMIRELLVGYCTEEVRADFNWACIQVVPRQARTTWMTVGPSLLTSDMLSLLHIEGKGSCNLSLQELLNRMTGSVPQSKHQQEAEAEARDVKKQREEALVRQYHAALRQPQPQQQRQQRWQQPRRTKPGSSRGMETMEVQQALGPLKDKKDWSPDAEAHECEGCSVAFWMFSRRHHCRSCGGVFCANCAPKQAIRLCTTCNAKNASASARNIETSGTAGSSQPEEDSDLMAQWGADEPVAKWRSPGSAGPGAVAPGGDLAAQPFHDDEDHSYSSSGCNNSYSGGGNCSGGGGGGDGGDSGCGGGEPEEDSDLMAQWGADEPVAKWRSPGSAGPGAVAPGGDLAAQPFHDDEHHSYSSSGCNNSYSGGGNCSGGGGGGGGGDSGCGDDD